jgi:hypothetical protein
MFEDQKVELLPERTTQYSWSGGGLNLGNQNGNLAIALALNVGNINLFGNQVNAASASAAAGSNFFG